MKYTVKALLILVVIVTILPVLIAIPFHVANLFQRDRATLDQSVRLTTQALLQSVDGNLRAAQNGLELLAGSAELTRGDLAPILLAWRRSGESWHGQQHSGAG